MTRRLLLLLAAGAAAVCAQGSRDLGRVYEGNPVRIVAFGDFGYRGDGSGQHETAAAIQAMHARQPFQLGITLGDNFYPRGVAGVEDSMWREIWEADYGRLGIPFFASLGNHDYRGNEQAQVDYTTRSKTWRMPHRYYTFAAGPVRFFALDTDEGTAGRWIFKKPWSAEQVAWLDAELARHAAAPWKIVYGHHPIYSDGHHGDEHRLQRQLLPLLKKHGVQVYLAGHDHDMQHHQVDGIEFFVAGGGGKDTRRIVARRPQTRFVTRQHGFLVMTATQNKLTLVLTGADGKTLHERALSR